MVCFKVSKLIGMGEIMPSSTEPHEPLQAPGKREIGLRRLSKRWAWVHRKHPAGSANCLLYGLAQELVLEALPNGHPYLYR